MKGKLTSPSAVADIIGRFNSGERPASIAKRYQVAPRSIQRMIKGHGCVPHGVGQPDNGLDIFRDIQCEADAYWLGFLMGDFTVFKNGNGMALSIIDKEHVEKFKAQYSIPCDITTDPKHLTNPNWSDMHRIGIYSQRSTSNASKWGLVYDKDLRTLPELPPSLLPHFYRGMIDADGSVNMYMQEPTVVLTSKEVFIRGLRQWLGVAGDGKDGFCGCICQKAHSTWSSTYTGVYAKLVAEKLYLGSTVSLDRKRLVADMIISGDFIHSGQSRRLDRKLHE